MAQRQLRNQEYKEQMKTVLQFWWAVSMVTRREKKDSLIHWRVPQYSNLPFVLHLPGPGTKELIDIKAGMDGLEALVSVTTGGEGTLAVLLSAPLSLAPAGGIGGVRGL